MALSEIACPPYAFAIAAQAFPAVMRTVLFGLFSLVKIKPAASGLPVLLNPMMAAHCRCSSGRFRKSR